MAFSDYETARPWARAIKEKGALRILAGCTHPILSGPALQRLNESQIDEVVATNTIPLNGKEDVCKKIKVLSVGSLLGEAVKRIHHEESLSTLFV